MQFRPDPTFYPSPKLAMQAPPEKLAYVVALGANGSPDEMTVVDVDSASPARGQIVGRVPMPNVGDELHHFGWNACSSALCPYAPHPHVERRYLIVPGLRSSRIYILDTEPDPRKPQIVKVIEAETIAARTGYSRIHTVHCGPDGIYVNATGSTNGDGPGGIFVLDHYSFDVLGRWEVDRGPQYYAYDFWWHLGYDTMLTSEWGTPNMVENGINPELLLAGKYGHCLHVWDLRKRRHQQVIDLGAEQQMVLELRPAHDPSKLYGFVGVVISLKDLSSSIWLWKQENGKFNVRKVIEIPAEPAGQYDVSDPDNPKLVGSVHLGGIARRAPHPGNDKRALNGGPQMVEISRDGRRVYLTNSLFRTWDDQFYPDGIRGWMAKIDVPFEGGMRLDRDFFVDYGDRRAHQVRLEGGDASSDSYCFPS